jgi:hypothetical protein
MDSEVAARQLHPLLAGDCNDSTEQRRNFIDSDKKIEKIDGRVCLDQRDAVGEKHT